MKSSIKNWPAQDRPREKFMEKGWEALTTAEVIAILLRTGTQESSAVDIAKELLSIFKDDLNTIARLSEKELAKIKGIGPTKAITILASLELAKRRHLQEAFQRVEVSDPKTVYDLMAPELIDKNVEEFWVLLLNRQNKLLERKKVFQGGMHGVYVDPKVIFTEALNAKASGIIMVHNHPSGSLTPSQADKDITQRIFRLGKDLELPLRDHLIVAGKGYFSFAEQGLIG